MQKDLSLESYKFDFPPELVAHHPVQPRDSSRLLILHRKSEELHYASFQQIHEFLETGDLLIVNDTKVIKARLWGQKVSGGRVELFLLSVPRHKEFIALVSPARRLHAGDTISLRRHEVVINKIEGNRAHCAIISGAVGRFLEEEGEIPLPPYIKRPVTSADDETYQTLFAQEEGALASPTAALHFTPEVLTKIEKKGVYVSRLTHHIGLGTFKPIRSRNVVEHEMDEESFYLSQSLIEQIQQSKRIVAVGTSVVRALEGSYARGNLSAGWQATKLFIYPSFKFKLISAMVTNFHRPCSTPLLLVSAFAGRELVARAYAAAIQNRYRLFSYGDSMLIL